MYVRTAGISKEVGEELVKRLEEFGWEAKDTGVMIRILGHPKGTMEEGGISYGVAMEIPIETILELTYYASDRLPSLKHETMGRDEELIDSKAPIESIHLNLGTRSELTFGKDGSVAVKI